jgi:hypothetical protein
MNLGFEKVNCSPPSRRADGELPAVTVANKTRNIFLKKRINARVFRLTRFHFAGGGAGG